MKKRVISECINVRVNVGNYQHIEITKQASEEIEYSSERERLDLEEELTNDLVNSVIRSMRTIPSQLGKGVDEAQEVEESISKAIPEWLNNQPPNLVDKAKEKVNRVAAEQKDNKDSTAEDILDVEESPIVESSATLDDDLFEEDEQPAKSEVIEEIKSEPAKVVEQKEADALNEVKSEEDEKVLETVPSGGEVDDFDFFEDDDLDIFNE